MLRFLLTRTLQAIAVLWVTTVLVFFGVYAIGDPIDVLVPPEAPAEVRDDAAARLGLDQPLVVQYGRFLGSLTRLELGVSFVHGIPVSQLIMSRLAASLELGLIATILATLVGVSLGVYAGVKPAHPFSRASMTGSLLGLSIPSFWVGLLLILGFSVEAGWLPAGGRGPTMTLLGGEWSVLTAEGWRHLVLPALTMGMFQCALMIRVARAATQEAMASPPIRYARAQGLAEGAILWHHARKLISIPVVAVLGLEMGSTLAFGVVTETVFAWPGLGKLIIDSILTLDRPVVVSYLTLTTGLFVAINLLTDIALAALDPRRRVARGGRVP